MVALICLCLNLVASLFKFKSRLEAENAALRHPLTVLRRQIRGRAQFTNGDRLFFIQLYRWCPSVLKAMMIIRPETLVRWHRAGFRRYWRWTGQSWGTFLRNHAPHIAAMDLFVVPTIGFMQLYVLVIVRLARRELVWINVTTHPTAEWIAQQISEAFPWTEAPRYLIRDRDGVYGAAVTRRLRAIGIRDKPIAPSSPWQNAYAERLIGTLRRECLDHGVPRTYRRRGRYGAVQEMGEGPSYPAIRSRMQTAASCCR
jgi:transposase InsO family protein